MNYRTASSALLFCNAALAPCCGRIAARSPAKERTEIVRNLRRRPDRRPEPGEGKDRNSQESSPEAGSPPGARRRKGQKLPGIFAGDRVSARSPAKERTEIVRNLRRRPECDPRGRSGRIVYRKSERIVYGESGWIV